MYNEINNKKPLLNLLVLGRIVVLMFLQHNNTFSTVLLATDWLLNSQRFLVLLHGLGRLFRELVDRFLMIHTGPRESVHTIAQIVISGPVFTTILLDFRISCSFCWYFFCWLSSRLPCGRSHLKHATQQTHLN